MPNRESRGYHRRHANPNGLLRLDHPIIAADQMSYAPPNDNTGEPAQRKPGRPRDLRTDDAIIAATLHLCAAQGVTGLSLDAVAAEAGCSKATIYRRWASKEELVAHALSRGPVPIKDFDTGSAIRDIELYVKELISRLPRGRADVIPHLVESGSVNASVRASLNEYNARREEPIRRILQRGVTRGELSPDVDCDAVIDVVLGPVMYRHLFSDRPMDSAFVEGFLHLVLSAVRRA